MAGPETCYYGVRYGSAQTYGTMPHRFVADLEDGVGRIAREHDQFTARVSNASEYGRQVGACVWPTAEGWFYFEASQRQGEGTYSVQFGLLTVGILTDPTSCHSFFRACGVDLPHRQPLWPLRQLVLTGSRLPPLERTEDVTATLTSDGDTARTHRVTQHGTNPVFGTAAASLGGMPAALASSVYEPLSEVSTLLYDPHATRIVEGAYALDQLVALEPPLTESVFVCGKLSRATGRTPVDHAQTESVEIGLE